MFGGDSEEVTPVPIPNTAVKLFSADGSWGFPPVRVGRRQAIIFVFFLSDWEYYFYKRSIYTVAGWSSPVARRAHNPKVAGSNPVPAIMKKTKLRFRFFVLSEIRIIMSLTYLFLLLKQGKLHIEWFMFHNIAFMVLDMNFRTFS
jgi:hypothetical protein